MVVQIAGALAVAEAVGGLTSLTDMHYSVLYITEPATGALNLIAIRLSSVACLKLTVVLAVAQLTSPILFTGYMPSGTQV